jgi:hypothetical protein
VQVLDVPLVEVDLGQGRGDLGVGEDARLLSLREEELDLLEFLQIRY